MGGALKMKTRTISDERRHVGRRRIVRFDGVHRAESHCRSRKKARRSRRAVIHKPAASARHATSDATG